MPLYETGKITQLLKSVSIFFHPKKDSPTIAIDITGTAEANSSTEGVPQGILGIGSFSVIRNGFRVNDTRLGRFCSIGPNVQFGNPEHPLDWLSTSSTFATDYQWTRSARKFPLSPQGLTFRTTTVGNDVWIGRGVFVKAGVIIGDGAVIGAGSMVTKDVPPYAVVGGNPARILKYRFAPEVIADLLRLRWWDLDPAWIREIDYKDIGRCIAWLERNGARYKRFDPPRVVFTPEGASLMRDGKVADFCPVMARASSAT